MSQFYKWEISMNEALHLIPNTAGRKQMLKDEAAQVAQQVRALAALGEDTGLIAGTYTAA